MLQAGWTRHILSFFSNLMSYSNSGSNITLCIGYNSLYKVFAIMNTNKQLVDYQGN